MYTPHTHCRACGYARSGAQGIKAAPTEKLIEVFDLGIQPLANDFCKDGEPRAGYAPLKVLYCPRCSLAQLSVTVDPEILYRKYCYVTSPSAMMADHFQKLLADIRAETRARDVLEIGSNDGRFLAFLKQEGYNVIGIDPAENLVKQANESGVPTQRGFFGEDTCRILPQSDIIIARHVFGHVDNWQDFTRGLFWLSSPHTVVFLEIPYVGDLLRNGEFDTIYHEHLSYISINAIHAALEGSMLRLHRIIRYPIHGGAMVLVLRRLDSPIRPDASVTGFQENITAADWTLFSANAHDQICRLRATIQTLQAQGKRVAGLGASAKSTVWINACGFQRKDISFIADTTPQKHYTFTPGTNIPIVDEGAILRDLPDYVVVWAWNYRDEILAKFDLARNKGVKFIVPIPKIEIV